MLPGYSDPYMIHVNNYSYFLCILVDIYIPLYTFNQTLNIWQTKRCDKYINSINVTKIIINNCMG